MHSTYLLRSVNDKSVPLSLSYRGGNWGIEGLSDSPMVTQWVRDQIEIASASGTECRRKERNQAVKFKICLVNSWFLFRVFVALFSTFSFSSSFMEQVCGVVEEACSKEELAGAETCSAGNREETKHLPPYTMGKGAKRSKLRN